jgi:hypothetical protein
LNYELKLQVSWTGKVFPKEQAVVANLIGVNLSNITPSFKKRIEKFILNPENQRILEDLIK